LDVIDKSSAQNSPVQLSITPPPDVGKGSLLMRYAHGSFSPGARLVADFECRPVVVDNKRIKVQVGLRCLDLGA
jgi:hypothetical protein